MSVEIEVDVELERNAASAVIVERQLVEIEAIFTDDELRLWQDRAGWSGFVREASDDSIRYFAVNTRHDEDRWIEHSEVTEQDVRDAIRDHIEDEHAGGAGNFVKRCSPP